jgi:two-component system NtrC family sensor kinase
MGRIEAAWVEDLLEALDRAGIGLVITRDGPAGLERLHDNRSAQRIFGRDEAALRSVPVMSIIAPEYRGKIQALREQVRAGTNPPATMDAVIVHPDGARVPIELGLIGHREGDNTIALVFVRDLSEQRAMQARLLEADRLATVGALCSGVAHEINNPLTSVVLHLGGLRHKLERWIPDPAARTHVNGVLDTVLAATDKVVRTVRELSFFADPGLGQRGPIDVRGVIEGAVKVATPMVHHRARLAVALAAVPLVDCDPPRLGQAVLNLILDAALSFERDDRGKNLVEVSLRNEEPWVVLEVADNGRVVDPQAAATAFEPFFPSRGVPSSGIGLAVTRTIVAALGGHASLTPRSGGGAVATIRLPPVAPAA